ncbi:MAG TPA: hypothetical protein VGC89_11295 [Pyrinomonadaceae bacterium]
MRLRGIYTLPDGREFVVGTIDEHGLSLFSPPAWLSSGVAEYRVHRDGRLLSKGTPTRWRVADLNDTGQTAQTRATANQGSAQINQS